MAELRGVEYLRRKLEMKRSRVLLRYKYYEMKNAVTDFNITTPPEFKWLKETLGWCGKAVDALADRLVFREFRNDNFDLTGIYQMNNADILYDSAVLSALISSCSFIYIVADEGGFPRMEVLDGGNATGIIDETTGMLREGYAVLERDDNGAPVRDAYFVAGKTTHYLKNCKTYERENPAPYPLLVPIIHRPDAMRPFGHSRISRACSREVSGCPRYCGRQRIQDSSYLQEGI